MRLLRFEETAHLATTLTKLAEHPIAGEVTGEARGFLEELFSDRDAAGAAMAVRASVGLEDELVIAIFCEKVAQRLLDAWKQAAPATSRRGMEVG